ncbi:carbohydrate ABC transporter permease [Facklamia sp. DSM 111018]|uniref:Carbohydrate ABC transporter permease n=1 Tax=Facklamia lactis TaxID=2749967 RepID=A0ABS0LNN4_9LACT|nr:carbohydrate ABC transporter permease [Facklamia lactis]MBG9979588.1 carbohydrate ABC transporter permease [Facklamia lactis]MBG9985732.1 carbohydrate ABC transporter permease [Facklamia lactis]
MKIKDGKSNAFHLLFIGIIILSIYPIIFGISNSFKTLQDAYNSILNLIPHPFTFENYQYLAETLPIVKITLNTFIVASVTTFVRMVTSYFAAYAITFFKFYGYRLLYFALISTIFIPFTVTMIPNYLLMSEWNFLDSNWGVILPQLADATGIFLLVQTMRQIPKPIIEAAKLDNVSDLEIIRGIVFPITRHAVTSVSIWYFITTWNEYVWPKIILSSVEHYTLPIALQNFISAEGGTNFTVAMAVTVITIIVPLSLYLIFQRYIIGSFTSSGIK